ncbi:MAG: GNAT family N-acetyltransferase [Caldilineaceae bacterium]
MTNAQLMQLHITTLYRFDEGGRLLATNELGFPTAPRFYLGRTTEGNFWRFRHDLPATICQRLEVLCQAEPVAADLRTPLEQYLAIRRVLEEDAPIEHEYRGPAYWLPERVSEQRNAFLLDEGNLHLVEPHFAWLLKPGEFQHAAPVAAVVEDGKAVSICFCSRIPGQASEAGLNTVEAYRGRGYAAAVVARWAVALRQQGYLPLYSTSWDNLSSQAVARKSGAICYGEDWSMD